MPDRTGHITFGIPVRQGVALVVGGFSLRQGKLHLRPAPVLYIDRKGNQGQSLLPHLASQTDELLSADQQLTVPLRLMVVIAPRERAPSLGKDELIYEAHFFSANSKKSVSIRQINDGWFIDEAELRGVNLDPKENPDVKEFHSKFKPEFSAEFKEVKIKMAQIWQDEKDEFCEVPQGNGTLEGLSVLKLQKIVFAGFVKDKKDKK